MKNFWYLFAAYTIIWSALWGYIIYLGRRQTRLSEKIDSLKAILGGKAAVDSEKS